MQMLNIPNTLTLLRIVLIPAFIIALEYNRYDVALYLFLFAALSDGVDGLIARIADQRTTLGNILDPLADKFMLVTAFIFYSSYGWLPEWLTIIVISRDVFVVVGWIVLFFITSTLKVEPSALGKTAIGFQFTTILYVLLNINYGFMPFLKEYLIGLTAVFSILSGAHYIYRGLRLSNAQ